MIRDQIFQRVFVRRQRELRGDQIGVALRHLRLVLLHVQRREAADLHALLVLIQLCLRQAKRLLLDLQIFAGVNKFVIGVFHRRDRGDQLLAQALLGQL